MLGDMGLSWYEVGMSPVSLVGTSRSALAEDLCPERCPRGVSSVLSKVRVAQLLLCAWWCPALR